MLKLGKIFLHIEPRKKELHFTFSTLLFTFLLVFLLALVEHCGSLRRLLQFGHERLDVIEAVVENPLGEEGMLKVNVKYGWVKQ